MLVSTTLSLALLLKPEDGRGALNRSSYTQKSSQNDAITFDEFISGHFSHKTFNGSWWSEKELQWKNKVSRNSLTTKLGLS